MKKPRRHIEPNYELRNELIRKGLIVPFHMVPTWLQRLGFEEAAKASAIRRGVAL